MKILINTPDISILGGVANHYKGLKPFWTEDVKYNFIGGRKGIPGPIILVYDFIKFFFLCAFGKYEFILLNPSLGETAIKRDAFFLRISKLFKIKTVIFFHGWSDNQVNKLNRNSKKFSRTFNLADAILVLAESFKSDLIKWGVTRPIYLTTTKVNDELISNFDMQTRPNDINILFLTRIEKYKGIYTTLEAFKIIKSKFPKAQLTVAGNGSQLSRTKDYVLENNILDVRFLGSVKGDLLVNTFSESSIYVLPSYSEGMPTSVLEAMAFGLPIISSPVGGLVDFFEEDKMGYLIENRRAEAYAEKIIHLLSNKDKMLKIGKYNHEYAKKNFMASKVALEIEKIISNV